MSNLIVDYGMFKSRVIRLLRKFRVLNVTLIGLMQTGKTNTAFFLAHLFNHRAKMLGRTYRVYYKSVDNIREVTESILAEDPKEDLVQLILDDISFLVMHYSKDVKEFLNVLTRIKHIWRIPKRIVIYTIIHYSKATVPFLKLAHIRGLTSITTPYEALSLKEYFTESSLWQFYQYKVEHLFVFDVLFNVMGYECIFRPRKVKKPENMEILGGEKEEVRILEIDGEKYLFFYNNGKYYTTPRLQSLRSHTPLTLQVLPQNKSLSKYL